MVKRFFLVVTMASLLLACGQESPKKTSQQTTGAGLDTSGQETLATVDGVAITGQDIEELMAGRLRQVRMDLYDARKEGIDRIIDEKLVEQAAKKEGLTLEELQKREVDDKIQVIDEEIKAFYEQNKQRFAGKPFDEVKDLVRGYLYQLKSRDAQGVFITKLRKEADIEFLIEPPRIEVAEGDHPSLGPDDAPVKIIEFSDYQCPFCGRSRPTVNQILSDYKDKVHYVFRDFPLSFHKDAEKAHEAAHCAREQGKYWEYNKKLFGQQRDLKIEDLKKHAKTLKLNQKDFEECLDSNKYQKMVNDSLLYGQTVGVSGTPAFFINGRMVSGARPYPDFKEIIDDELSRVD